MLQTFPLSDYPARDVNWLWPARIPREKLTLIQGDPNVGKSYLTAYLAACVSTGAPWPDGSGNAPNGRVLMFSAEDDPHDTIRPRIDMLGGTPSMIDIAGGVAPPDSSMDVSFMLDQHVAELRDRLAGGNYEYVVVDPISAYLGGIESHDNAQVRRLLADLSGLAEAQGPAIVCVTHLNKNAIGKSAYRAMGSIGFVAAARAVWQVQLDRNDRTRRLLLPVKLNIAPNPTGLAFRISENGLVWEPEPIDLHADDALAAEIHDGEDRSQLAEAIAFLEDTLIDGPKPSAKVISEARQLGISQTTLQRARRERGVTRWKDGAGAWMMQLPDATEA